MLDVYEIELVETKLAFIKDGFDEVIITVDSYGEGLGYVEIRNYCDKVGTEIPFCALHDLITVLQRINEARMEKGANLESLNRKY